MQIHSKTDVGLVRSSNQDAFMAGELAEQTVFAIVCDGMGGANAGNIASGTAVKSISEYIIRSYRKEMDSYGIEGLLKNAIVNANMEIYDMALKNNELSGMGTTVVAVVVRDNKAVIAHVGDSRAYVVSDELTQLTKDHSMVQSLVESGKISPEDARVHPRKNVITRALGVEENVICDITDCILEQGQALLLCTDGLSGSVDALDIYKAVNGKNREKAPERLIDLALKNGGKDNITVVVIDNL